VRALVPVCGLVLDLDLDPHEEIDGNLLFHPQLYDPRELGFVRRQLPVGGCFVDVGANIGLYSLVAGCLMGPRGTLVAIEPEPVNHRKLVHNLVSNGLDSAVVVQMGVAARRETLQMRVGSAGQRGRSTLVPSPPSEETIEVPCAPLLDILSDRGVGSIDVMKCDIEGFESIVLGRFFATAPRALWPRAAIVEFFGQSHQGDGGDPIERMCSIGYELVERAHQNYMLELR
jgi:FkbM family methyltransferase